MPQESGLQDSGSFMDVTLTKEPFGRKMISKTIKELSAYLADFVLYVGLHA